MIASWFKVPDLKLRAIQLAINAGICKNGTCTDFELRLWAGKFGRFLSKGSKLRAWAIGLGGLGSFGGFSLPSGLMGRAWPSIKKALPLLWASTLSVPCFFSCYTGFTSTSAAECTGTELNLKAMIGYEFAGTLPSDT